MKRKLLALTMTTFMIGQIAACGNAAESVASDASTESEVSVEESTESIEETEEIKVEEASSEEPEKEEKPKIEVEEGIVDMIPNKIVLPYEGECGTVEAITYMAKDYTGDGPEVEKKAYVIFEKDKAIGITVMSVPNEEELEDGCISYIEEMFIETKSRGKKIATDIVKRFLRQQDGNVGFCVLKNNDRAVGIWEELIKNEGYRWKRFESEEDTWFYRVEKAISE